MVKYVFQAGVAFHETVAVVLNRIAYEKVIESNQKIRSFNPHQLRKTVMRNGGRESIRRGRSPEETIQYGGGKTSGSTGATVIHEYQFRTSG